MLLDGKTALVTGASRGIGRAIALRLAAEGASVAINYAGNTAKAEETKAAIEAAGGKAALFQADVSDSAQVEQMVAAVTEAFGTIDILVNNAGITRDGLLMRMKEEDFDAVLDTNLKGIFHVTSRSS
jgi:3-oxoacyl-[acyl-carrier protein] reductase